MSTDLDVDFALHGRLMILLAIDFALPGRDRTVLALDFALLGLDLRPVLPMVDPRVVFPAIYVLSGTGEVCMAAIGTPCSRVCLYSLSCSVLDIPLVARVCCSLCKNC